MIKEKQFLFRNLFLLSCLWISLFSSSITKGKAAIRPEGTYGPSYTSSGGIHIAGLTGNNKMIYDNDWFYDIIDAGYLVAKHKLGQLELRGIIVTADFFYGNGRIQGSIDDFTDFRNNAITAGLTTVPNYTAGANAMLSRPGNGNISETSFTRTAGSDLIVAEARLCTPENPLVVCVGGPATTVATALLQDPSIEDNIVVLMCDLTDYNNKDTWAIYVVSKRTRFFAYPFILNHGYSDAVWNQLPKNVFCDHFHTSLVKQNAVGDGALLAWFFNNSMVKNVQKKTMTAANDWTNASSSPYGFLYIEKSTSNFDGAAMCQQMVNTLKDPNVYIQIPALPAVSVVASHASAGELSNNGEFTFSVSTAFSVNTTINDTVSSTATNGIEYSTIATSVVLTSWQTSVKVPLLPKP